jgi:hypothetical protein
MRVAAVGSRDLGRAEALAAELGAESAYGSYEQLCADPADNGYAGELREVRAAVAEGRTESPIMPLDESLAMMGLLADARRQLG